MPLPRALSTWLLIALAAMVLLHRPAHAAIADIEQGARKEGEVTWYVSHYGAEPAFCFASATICSRKFTAPK